MAIKQRNLVTNIILTLVTCNLYGMYWAYLMTKDVLSLKETEDSGMLEIILMILVPFVGIYLVEKRFAETCAEKGIVHKENTILYAVVTFICPVVGWALLQNELNKIATE